MLYFLNFKNFLTAAFLVVDLFALYYNWFCIIIVTKIINEIDNLKETFKLKKAPPPIVYFSSEQTFIKNVFWYISLVLYIFVEGLIYKFSYKYVEPNRQFFYNICCILYGILYAFRKFLKKKNISINYIEMWKRYYRQRRYNVGDEFQLHFPDFIDFELEPEPVLEKFQNHEETITCLICYETIDKGTKMICGHMYCEACLQSWFIVQSGRKCPYCRQ